MRVHLRRKITAYRALAAALGAVALSLQPGCFACGLGETAYEIVGDLVDETGMPLADSPLRLHIEGADGDVYGDDQYFDGVVDVESDSSGHFETGIGTLFDRCGFTLIGLILPPPPPRPQALPNDPRLIITDENGVTLLEIPITDEMIERTDSTAIDRINLGHQVIQASS